MEKIDLNKLNQLKSNKSSSENKKTINFDFLNKEINFFGSKFNDNKKERFYAEMQILLSSGIDIRAALELVEEEQTKEVDKKLIAQIKETIIAGSSFAMALEKCEVFSQYEYFSVKIGEETGKLNDVLLGLSKYFADKIKLKRQFTSALTYPLIISLVAIGAVIFMLKFLVPMFTDLYKQLGGEMPYITLVVIKISDIISKYFFVSLIGIALISIFFYVQRKAIWFRKTTSAIVLRIPVFKKMISQIYLSRFCQSMHLLLSSKTPLLNSLELVEQMIGFYPIESSLKLIKEDVLRGKPLHISMSKYKIYNSRLVSLIKVGEEVNQLDTMFDRIAKQYSQEIEHQSAILGSLLQPFIILFLGFVIGGILLAMYLPMFNIGSGL